MIKAGQIDKGMCLLFRADPYLVAEREFVNPGKGAAFVRLKLKNLKTGQVLRETMKTQEQVEDIHVDDYPFQYLFADGDSYHFMNTENYEQIEIPMAGDEEKQNYLKEGETYDIVLWDETPIDIKIPYKMVFVVTEAEDAVRGDTVTGATKTVKVETGLQVKVPIFINQGDKILVNTESNEYVERVNT
ncbi:MAG: elongation factor P [Spirochaetales bacterium]|nr:elongation factor P [Spirochaetales bacterium]MCF7937829.1 elongation factor P [Spirochaetales bacterium]